MPLRRSPLRPVVYASGSVRTKAKAGSTARPASLAEGAARRIRIVLILLVVLLRLSATPLPNGRQVLLVSLGRRKPGRRSNGQEEEAQKRITLSRSRREEACISGCRSYCQRPSQVQPCNWQQAQSSPARRRQTTNLVLRSL